MKKSRIAKLIIWFLIALIQLSSIILLSYSLTHYKGIETFYRIYVVIILIYLLIFTSYISLTNIKTQKSKSYIISIILSILFSIIAFVGYYYLNNVYKAVNSYSKSENEYFSSLVTYNTKLNDYKDLNKSKIGIIKDTSDIEGNVLPNEIIDNLKLSKNNEIVSYDSTIELLHALKTNKVDAAFFSSNYTDMFYSLEGYENIKEETKVLYKTSKIYDIKEETKSESSLTKPFTMLLIGVDSSNDGVTSGYNADVLILATFNPKTLRATMTSVPRDMYLKTACSNGKYRRINTTTWGSSSSCAVQTIEKLFSVDIDYYAKINFKGIVSLVDALGGIDVDVPYSFCDQNSSRNWGNSTVFVNAGKNHLNGEQALALSRNRHKPNDGSKAGKAMANYCPNLKDGTRNDYTRGKNQIKVIMGIVNAATKLKDPNEALDILKTIDKNFQTNIKSDDVMSLYNLGKSILINGSTNLINIQRSQLNGYNAYKYIYDTSSKSYPAVTIPYTGSINDIKELINTNLDKKELKAIKNISFDINNKYEDELIGNGKYTQSKIPTLKNLSSYSLDDIKTYASNNKLKLKFIDVDTNIEITNYEGYKFYSQKEHKDTILNQIDTLTIYIKK